MSYANLAIWCAQVALLAAVAAGVAALFRLRPAPARLIYWQVLLAVCLALPAIEPWQRRTLVLPAAAPAPAVAAAVAAPPAPAAPLPRRFGWPEGLAAVLAAGVLLRLGWFGLGLARLARYRRAARLLHPLPPLMAEACHRIGVYPEIGLSDEIAGPVTFGSRNPIVLFPARFPELDAAVQFPVACHELLHVRRRDWLFTALEELVRAAFWFHPAIWWVLGQIQLAREQSVDREVVQQLAEDRERYVDALLALSGAGAQFDLAPAPLFLRRRHLTARVAAILKETDMSRRRKWGAMAACAGCLLAAGWLVSVSLPLEAAPQLAADPPGVTVTGADRMLHRTPVEYPAETRAKGIEGTVVLDVRVAADGTVADAAVVGGPMELRRAALTSVLGWHFMREAAGSRHVTIEFKADAQPVQVAGPAPGVGGGVFRAGGAGPGGIPDSRRIAAIEFRGLTPEAAEELRRRLPVRDGEVFQAEGFRDALNRVERAAREFDSHLVVSPTFAMPRQLDADGKLIPPATAEVTLRISPRGAPQFMMPSEPTLRKASDFPETPGVQRVRVDVKEQAAKLKQSPAPVYPPLAQQAKISGVVRLDVVIGADGRVAHTRVVSGHPLLVAAALEAVKQWQYEPNLVNGSPAEVATTVEVTFGLR